MEQYYKGWHEGMSLEETKNLAYWERNMLALLMADLSNDICQALNHKGDSGWYFHEIGEGWSRVISLFNGQITFHVPDNFDLGHLQQIEPNWDGHTTEQKWLKVAEECGVKFHD